MKRRQLLKGLFSSLGLLIGSTAEAKPAAHTYTFKELFTNRVFRNNNMFFLKKSKFKDQLYKDVSHLISDSGGFYYMGEHDVTLPIKAVYTEKELEEFFIVAKHRILTYNKLLQNPKGEPIYFMRNPRFRMKGEEKNLTLNLICDNR